MMTLWGEQASPAITSFVVEEGSSRVRVWDRFAGETELAATYAESDRLNVDSLVQHVAGDRDVFGRFGIENIAYTITFGHFQVDHASVEVTSIIATVERSSGTISVLMPLQIGTEARDVFEGVRAEFEGWHAEDGEAGWLSDVPFLRCQTWHTCRSECSSTFEQDVTECQTRGALADIAITAGAIACLLGCPATGPFAPACLAACFVFDVAALIDELLDFLDCYEEAKGARRGCFQTCGSAPTN